MRKGFQFLKTRPLSEKLDIESYKEKNNIKLPLLIRTFYATFTVEPEGMYFDKLSYYDWRKDKTRITEYGF